MYTKKQKIEPQEFEIFHFENCKQNQVVIVKIKQNLKFIVSYKISHILKLQLLSVRKLFKEAPDIKTLAGHIKIYVENLCGLYNYMFQ